MMDTKALISTRNECAKIWLDLYALSARLDRQHEPNVMSPLKRMIARGNVAANMTKEFLETKGDWFNAHLEVKMNVVMSSILMRHATRVPSFNPAAIFSSAHPSMEIRS